MFFGSPEKLYFLSYDIFICRRRFAFKFILGRINQYRLETLHGKIPW